jgi:hypothetical protein
VPPNSTLSEITERPLAVLTESVAPVAFKPSPANELAIDDESKLI